MNEEKKEVKPICCLCGNECENEWGNNPFPVDTDPMHRCCDVCNDTKVIPARIEQAMNRRKENEK